jgi:dTDP-4-amino-4,6-dideoxygalactose transaminase
MIQVSRPLIGEEEKNAVLEVLESGMLAQGSKVAIFEKKFASYCGVRYAIATSSGTTALHTALLAHNIGNGDEVITTPFTFIASSNAIIYVGARPIFVDIDIDTFNMDVSKIEAAITHKTKAILPIHLFGLAANMDAVMEIARKHSLLVIEDACQAHGAEYKGRRVGSFGTGCFSFYPTKNMTSGEGGMITTDNPEIAERSRMIRQHGMKVRYYHEDLGFNFRMTDVHAAIGLAQLTKLENFNSRRIMNAEYYSNNLRNVKIPSVPEGYRHVFNQYTIRVPLELRDGLLEKLKENDICSDVYYPIPIHKQKIYLDLGYDVYLPQSELASREVLSLPIHPRINEIDLKKVIEVVNEFCK